MNDMLNPSGAAAAAPQSEPANIAVILKDIQQRLSFLERKIDTLLNQSPEKPAFQRRFSPKSGRPFNRFDKPRGGHYNNEPRGENFSPSQSRHFDKPREESNQGFGAKKKRFFHRGKGPHR